ncbi:reverse transcriptase domain-containing protein [Artemisia annua]|uniref:Reverse transcriptase domain-containing protein n=1 Tax=Artemisia annua TaxID=35608 RepID=A0A2U1NJS5_ARTAN|nr:reverse transcriptase domain-containing protein [Artemisia annua]
MDRNYIPTQFSFLEDRDFVGRADVGVGTTANPTNSRALHCFKCQGLGHIARECPNKQLVIIVDDITPVYDTENDEDVVQEIDELVYADQRDALMTQSVLNVNVVETRSANVVADALSRRHVLTSSLQIQVPGFDTFRELYQDDPDFPAVDYIELSHLLNLFDFSSPFIAPLFTRRAEPNIMLKALKNGLLITVDAVGFTQESDLQIKMEHGCVVVKGEASTVKGDKVVNEVVPVPVELKYDPSEVIAQLIGGVVLVFVPNGSKEEGKDMCVTVVWGDVMKLIAI